MWFLVGGRYLVHMAVDENKKIFATPLFRVHSIFYTFKRAFVMSNMIEKIQKYFYVSISHGITWDG